MKKKGFTLIELLVVIAIIALLMGILMPALNRVRQLAHRVVCGSNLKGIGTALNVFSNDHNQKYPQIPSGAWDGTVNTGTITSAFYQLISNEYTQPDQFICKSDPASVELELTDFSSAAISFSNENDFGATDPWDYCSYGYHAPWGIYALGPASPPGMAVAADWNPFMGGDTTNFSPLDTGPLEERRAGNCEAHQKEGQNVLYNDIHVKFEEYSYCAIDNDNIYTFWLANPPTGTSDIELGNTNVALGSIPKDKRKDSLILNNPAK